MVVFGEMGGVEGEEILKFKKVFLLILLFPSVNFGHYRRRG